MKNLAYKVYRYFQNKRFRSRFESLPDAHFDASNLGSFSEGWLTHTFQDSDICKDWEKDAIQLKALKIPDLTGGVNPGDQRALYYLARKLQPKRLLEIGTHIGSSTAALALALSRSKGTITTVDIRDVNDPSTRPWEEAQSPASPVDFLTALDLRESVEFKISCAVDFLSQNDHWQYEIIFLDGDHSAEAVYREVPLALRRLSPGGMIILHDFFPDGRPLWKGHSPILGPWSAIDRFVTENAPFRVLPLGKR